MKQNLKTLITIVVTAAVTFSITAVFMNNKNGSDSESKDFINKINTVNGYIDRHYLYDDVDYSKLNDAAVKAYVEALGEPYTHYYNEEEFSDYMSAVEESYTGIGIVITADVQNDMIMVLSPFIDSPAYNAGILPGDYILAVDGTAYTASSMQECVDYIKSGEEGTKIVLDVLRGDETLKIDVKRGNITENSVSSEMITDEIGYICITNFNMSSDESEQSTYTEFVEELLKLNDSGMEKLIIDLRDNPGGVMEEVINIADLILPEGVITYTQTRDGEREEYMSDAMHIDIPIVVLINNNSASASEILTGALKDYDYAEVVGEKSYGKGIVQRVYPFADGSGMSMTVAKYFTPAGICIHDVGIEPDYVVEMPQEYEGMYANLLPRDKDAQLQKAIEILSENK